MLSPHACTHLTARQLIAFERKVNRPVQSGWLTKKGKGGQLFARKNWCRRWYGVSHHITSHHITSHHITSQHITSHHITSHHITSHHRNRFQLSERYLTYGPDPESKEVYGKIDIKQITDVANGDDDVVHSTSIHTALTSRHVTLQSFRIVTIGRTYHIRSDDAESKALWLRQLRQLLDLPPDT